MTPQLYELKMQGKNKRYVPYIPPEAQGISPDLTPEQIVTMIGTLGVCLIHTIYESLPDHTRLAREISKVHDAILCLYKNTGHHIDNATVDHVVSVWNGTMAQIQADTLKIEFVDPEEIS